MAYGSCALCGGGNVTYAKKRGTHLCQACGVSLTPEEYNRWYQPDLPLNEMEINLVRRAWAPTKIVTQRLLATLDDVRLKRS